MHRARLTSLFLIGSLFCFAGCGGGGTNGGDGGGGSDSSSADSFEIQTTPGVAPIQIEVLTKGDGVKAGPGKVATVHYALSLPGGDTIESSRNGQPFEFRIGAPMSAIEGWHVVVGQMRVGDRWKATLPPELAYGQRGSPPVIPPNATLVFDMELMAVR